MIKTAELKKRTLNLILKKKVRIGIIGLGYVGLPLALLFAKKGFKIFGFDNDYKKIKSINKNIKIFRSTYKALNLNKLNKKMEYLMFCGIGNPHEFEKTLLKNKFKIKKKIIFPDHHEISRKEINNIKETAKNNRLNIITTEKDYYRLSKNQRIGLKVLKIKLEIQNLDKFKKILFSINEKN